VWNAKGVETVLRARASAFFDVQLLPAAAVAGNEARKKHVHQGTPASSPRVRIPSSGVCGDAQPCASLDERAKEGHSIHGFADAQATRLPKDEGGGAREADRATITAVSEVRREFAAVLAAEVLRFQRVQPREEKRKAGIYARQSGGTRTCRASERLAMEQFFLLCERRSGFGGDRYCEFVMTGN